MIVSVTRIVSEENLILTHPSLARFEVALSAYEKNSTSQCVRDVARTDDLRRFEIKRKKASCENMRLCVSTRSICSSFTSCQTHRATRMGSLATPRLGWRRFPWSAWLASAASG